MFKSACTVSPKRPFQQVCVTTHRQTVQGVLARESHTQRTKSVCHAACAWTHYKPPKPRLRPGKAIDTSVMTTLIKSLTKYWLAWLHSFCGFLHPPNAWISRRRGLSAKICGFLRKSAFWTLSVTLVLSPGACPDMRKSRPPKRLANSVGGASLDSFMSFQRSMLWNAIGPQIQDPEITFSWLNNGSENDFSLRKSDFESFESLFSSSKTPTPLKSAFLLSSRCLWKSFEGPDRSYPFFPLWTDLLLLMVVADKSRSWSSMRLYGPTGSGVRWHCPDTTRTTVWRPPLTDPCQSQKCAINSFWKSPGSNLAKFP